MIYSYRHRITDCDPFTDDFLTAQGIKVNPKEPEPKDQFGEHRSKVCRPKHGRPWPKSSTCRYTGFFWLWSHMIQGRASGMD